MSGAVARILDAPPPGWDLLLREDPGATPAHRPELWAAMEQTLPGMRARFAAVEEGGALKGGAGLLIERRAGFHWIHALPFSLSGAPLARDGSHAAVDVAVGEALGALQRRLGSVGGAWVLYRPRGPEVGGEALAAASGETRVGETSLLELEHGIEPAWRRLGPQARHALRRARASGLRFAEEPEAVEEAYALHLAQARGWPGYRPLPIELSRRLVAMPAASPPASAGPAARLFTVRHPRGLLAAMLFLDHPRETFAWWGGCRAGGRALHAMPFLYWSVAEWACGAGRARLNLGGSAGLPGLSSFKGSLGGLPHRYPLRWLGAERASPAGRWIARVQARVRRDRFRGAVG